LRRTNFIGDYFVHADDRNRALMDTRLRANPENCDAMAATNSIVIFVNRE